MPVTVYKPWGSFSYLETGTRMLNCKPQMFWVKVLTILQKESISLQSHEFRIEMWEVILGEGLLELDGKNQIISWDGVNQIIIPIGCKHRVGCTGERPLVIKEFAYGPYVGEDDVIRYEDKYGRCNIS